MFASLPPSTALDTNDVFRKNRDLIEFLRYEYKGGTLIGARTKSGKKVPVDAFEIPV